MEITSCLPDIPHDKKYHLFVCYEGKSLDIVENIVTNLEIEGVVCCYYERDFLPGRSITENMYEAIGHSMNMLIVLSDELETSHYCLDEIDKAFNLRVHGQYNLIPIRIEPCSIPECLQHIVYIDVEDAIDVAHIKIIDALFKRDQQITLNEGRNGECSVFGLQAYKPSCLYLTRYTLNITEKERATLWNNHFEVSAEVIQNIEDTVNGSYFMKFQHIIHHQYLTITILYLYILLLIMIIFLILLINCDREKSEKMGPTGYCLAIGLPTWLILYIATYFVIICSERQKGLYGLNQRKLWCIVSESLWEISRQHMPQTGVLFFLKPKKIVHPKDIQIYMMRINLKPCEVYFKRQLLKEEKAHLKKLLKDGEEYEEYTSRIFDKFLSRNCAMLVDVSTNRRHNMTNNAKCVCLLVDEWLK